MARRQLRSTGPRETGKRRAASDARWRACSVPRRAWFGSRPSWLKTGWPAAEFDAQSARDGFGTQPSIHVAGFYETDAFLAERESVLLPGAHVLLR
jgi:hypothetical protein